ncbi:transmembrane protein 26-like [Saccoglossus kowalevskii]|uniref:Transmembrane protein 26-like n=1 Tax=Saccoglossus kowalevskii TaxID=10224 RepID=A0ABM0LZT3_SACKO|nr:PREDICTED: transmembrane protein 26-like [Saccoglossus kowalevskii]
MAIITIVKACIVRLLFAVHGILAIWRVADVKHDPSYWCLLVSLMGLVCETTLTLKLRHGEEWKWFCPSVLFYLGCVLPCMWILELENMEKRLVYRDTHGLANCSEINIFDKYESLVASNGVELPISFRSNDWVLAMQQLLLGLLIVGRWILPKGEITRDQLSQLLLVYIGIAADILEFQ